MISGLESRDRRLDFSMLDQRIDWVGLNSIAAPSFKMLNNINFMGNHE
jgi:hypothetical protein